jgi:nifR3 family TIM-barrel protein
MVNFWKKLSRPFTVLAPMEDVTDIVFREIIAQTARPDVFVTEFTSAEGLASRGRDKVIHRLAYTENQRPIVAQIWGTDEKSLTTAAQLIESRGFDGIDINMGCPIDAVMKKGAGAGCIGNYELAERVIAAVTQGAPHIPISVKTRLGIKTNSIDEWIRFLLKQDLAAITLHARTSEERSKVPAHWDMFGVLASIRQKISPETIIIANGDVASYQQVIDIHKKYGVDGVMIGRGVFTNPWIFEKNAIPTQHEPKEYLELLLQHLEKSEKTWGTSKNFQAIKKFYKMYIQDFPGAQDLRNKLMELTSAEETIALLSEKITSVSS